MKKNVLLYCMLLCLLVSKSLSQSPTYSFEFYNTSHGLPTVKINTLAKDTKGYLWLGTATGLSKYDGYTFANYTYTQANEWIGDVKIIKADDAGNLWIGSSTGLYYYAQNNIIKLSNSTNTTQAINAILIENDIVWLAGELGLMEINKKGIDFSGTKKINLANHLSKEWISAADKQTSKNITKIARAADNTLFAAQFHKLFRFANNKWELVFEKKNERDYILSLHPISKVQVFFDCTQTEMNEWNNGVNTILYNQNKATVPVVGKGFWYIGTSGLYHFHPGSKNASQHISTLEKDVYEPNAYLQDDDFFWVASDNGLVKIKPIFFTHYNLTAITKYKDFYAAHQFNNGNWWIGSNRGIVIEKKKEQFNIVQNNIVPNAEVKAIYKEAPDKVWVGTGYQGIALWQNGKIKNYTIADGLHDNSIYSFIKTSKGLLYAMGDYGITRIETANQKNSFTPIKYAAHISWHCSFYAAIEAPDGKLWVAGQEGLAYLKEDSLHRFLLNNKELPINYIAKDKTGNIWLATNTEGIYQCKFNNKFELEIIQQYTIKDGLNTLNYNTLLIDNDNNIWAGSAKGLTFIEQNKTYDNRILNYTEADGFIKSGYSYIQLQQGTQGEIFAATINGLASFKPQSLLVSNNTPLVYITTINQSSKNINIIDDSVAQHTFSYKQNSFEFSFTALDYSNSEGIHYYYQLEGLDTTWKEAGKQRTVNYAYLKPGSYLFKVKALNSKGKWSQQEAKYQFKILKAFWQRWWFIVAASVLAILIFYGYLKRREKLIAEKEARKTEVEKLKTENYRHQLETEQIINYFTASISNKNSIDDLLWDVSKNLIGKLGFEECMIYLWNKDKTMLIQRAGYGLKGAMQIEENKNVYHIPKGKGIVGAVADTGESIIVNDTSKDKRYFSADVKIMFSELSVPIIHNKEVIGVINTEHSKKNFFTLHHAKILSTIGALCAEKIDKINAEKHAKEKEVQVLKLSKDLIQSQLTALQSQMNPHFIFNAMNTIQQFTLKNDVDNANLYISKFSTLLRKVLHSSQQNSITLEEEIEQLKLYIDIEKIRLGETFSYTINIDNDIETDAINMPSMLIQPLVENAIKHGLSLKEGSKKLILDFKLTTNNLLHVTIFDNGIGRQKATKLKKSSERFLPHQSKGILLVQERLKLLGHTNDIISLIKIEDCIDENKNATGTKVSISLPLN